ncbi:hypothetical protein JZ785_15685 [Alicyclobacillus curvatus]|nr:hypothetical protein JZ785_15685 [Alicyclobacillus curvatus]
MSLAVPFWNYFWHIVGLIFILVICLPTNYWRRINKWFAIHRELVPSGVTDMSYGGLDIPEPVAEELVGAYNDGNFLYRKPVHTPPPQAIPLVWRYPGRQESYTIYLSSPYVDVVKTKGRKTTVFTLQSNFLHDWLANRG